jgi:P4 family phage/plasmid primase-like protien
MSASVSQVAEQSFDVAFFKSKKDNAPKAQTFTWNDFFERFRVPHVRTDKDGESFAPATFIGKRAKENVESVSMLVLDYDHDANFDVDFSVWRDLGFTLLAYTTHSHKENAQRFRIVLPLKEPISAADFPRLWKWAALLAGGKIDKAASDASRMFYTPSKASATSKHRFEVRNNALLDWRTLDLPKVVAQSKAMTREPSTKTASKLTLNANAQPPQEKFDALCQIEPRFKHSFEHKRKDMLDQSASSYDLSLATFAAQATWSDQEIANLIISHRRKYDDDVDKALRQDYQSRTIALARAASRKHHAEVEAASGITPEIIVDECNDDGNARRFVRQHGDDVRYCASWHSWLIYDGKRWQTDKTLEIERRAKQTARKIANEAAHADDDKTNTALLKHAQRTKQAKGIKDMLLMARSDVPVTSDTLDGNRWLLNCENGTIDLRTGELREHNRNDYITKMVNINYDTSAQCPTFLAFLDHIMKGNANLVSFLCRAVGYSLTGDVSERVMFILHGRGKNGKTVFCETISELLGDYAKTTPASTLMSKRDSTATNDVAALKGARFVFANETDENKHLDEAGIKNITGGDTISARFLYSEYFNFKPESKLWLRTNHKPVVRGTDEGIWDRLKLIPFAVRIAKQEQDTHLAEKLRSEQSGILAWAVQGCLEWQRDGLGIPEEVETATAKYRKEQDNFANFISECCIVTDNAWTPTAALRNAYDVWCKERGERPSVTGNAFTERLRAINCYVKSGRHAGNVVRGWQGIGLE